MPECATSRSTTTVATASWWRSMSSRRFAEIPKCTPAAIVWEVRFSPSRQPPWRGDRNDQLATVTLLAAQTDFSEPGELQLFTDESGLALLDDVMWRQGYLDSTQMAGAFQLLRSNDLIWSRVVKSYLLGEREQPSDLMAWNADATRMPYRMHSEYLHQMFLHNDLAEGRYIAGGESIALQDIHAPIFSVSTENDHVAPWRSVYKIHLLNSGDITFVLTSGGHNAGIVSEPGHPGRHFRMMNRPSKSDYLSPDEWAIRAA